MRMRVVAAVALAAGIWWLARLPTGGAAALAAVADLARTGARLATTAAAGEGDPAPAEARPVVVISPGHGWWSARTEAIDPGDSGAGLVEKDVALDVAVQAREILTRCAVDARLTRSGDDREHTLAGVHELVNAGRPRLALVLYISDAAAAGGVAAWYTVGGWDDAGSQRLAERLAAAVAGRLALPNRGVLPETAGGGLYIHPWQAAAALVELGSLGADSAALRDRRRDLARAVAEAVLAELGQPAACASLARVSGWPVAVGFPGEALSASLTLTNDGLQPWTAGVVALRSAGEAYGAAASFPLPAFVAPGESVTWAIPARAPDNAGVYEQRWQLTTTGPDGQAVTIEAGASVTLVVVPPQAQELRQRLEREVAEAKAAGEARADAMIQELQDEITAWALAETRRQAARCLGVNGALALAGAGLAVGRRRRRTRDKGA